jgi:putative sigma-54 modulation protein
MSIEITARHMEAPDKLQEYIQNKAQIIIEEFPRVEHIHIVLNHEKHRYTGEVVVQAKDHIRVEASEISDKIIFSVDKAFEKVEKQLRKLTDKVHDHKAAMKMGEREKKRL